MDGANLGLAAHGMTPRPPRSMTRPGVETPDAEPALYKATKEVVVRLQLKRKA